MSIPAFLKACSLHDTHVDYTALAWEARNYAAANGVVMFKRMDDANSNDPQNPAASTIVHAPCTLFPTPCPRKGFDFVRQVAPIFNHLYDAISRDISFLESTLALSSALDKEFTGNIMKCLIGLTKERKSKVLQYQDLQLAINRSDYMFHIPAGGSTPSTDDSSFAATPLQVEFNTMSSSFGALSTQLTSLHKALLSLSFPELNLDASLEKNDVTTAIVESFSIAHKLYCQQFESQFNGVNTIKYDSVASLNIKPLSGLKNTTLPPLSAPSAALSSKDEQLKSGLSNQVAVLFIVQPNENNRIDQKHLEYTLLQCHRVRVLRATLQDIYQSGYLVRCTSSSYPSTEPASLHLFYQSYRISVVYFRASYTPKDYPTINEWHALAMLEASMAIKCPSLAMHLSGSKKIQQALSGEGIVEKFLSNDESKLIRQCFAGLWGFDNNLENTKDLIERVRANPTEYVLKPQREGGGNNLWDTEMLTTLTAAEATMISTDTNQVEENPLAQYIVMQKIRPRPVNVILMRDGNWTMSEAISELGIFGCFISSSTQIYLNECSGHLLRTKVSNENEGGVAAGFAVLDTPWLIDDELYKSIGEPTRH